MIKYQADTTQVMAMIFRKRNLKRGPPRLLRSKDAHKRTNQQLELILDKNIPDRFIIWAIQQYLLRGQWLMPRSLKSEPGNKPRFPGLNSRLMGIVYDLLNLINRHTEQLKAARIV